MYDLGSLRHKAQSGKVTSEEFDYVLKAIKQTSPGNDEDLYGLLYTLGFIGAPANRKIVEPFLYYPSNPMITVRALDVLCNDWNLGRDYIEQIKDFIRGVAWDEDQDIKLKAISMAGEYLRIATDKDLLKMLIEILTSDDPIEDDSVEEIFWDCAYESLLRAMGWEWKDILSGNHIDFDSLIREANKRIKEK